MLKRVLAVTGIIILVGLYIATLVSAIMGFEGTGTVFMASVTATIVVPVMIHLFLMINNVRQGRSIMDDPYGYRNGGADRDTEQDDKTDHKNDEKS